MAEAERATFKNHARFWNGLFGHGEMRRGAVSTEQKMNRPFA